MIITTADTNINVAHPDSVQIITSTRPTNVATSKHDSVGPFK
jgi:hypothetical protein